LRPKSWPLTNLKVAYVISIYSVTNWENKRTVHHHMVPLPEERLVIEVRLGDGSRVLPIPPRCPVLSEIDAIPQLLGSERAMSKDEIVTALGQRRRVVVGIWEDHSVVGLALPKEKMVDCLIAQTRKSVRTETVNVAMKKWLTPVRTPLWLAGLLIVIVNTPSATSSIVPFQYHLETVAPMTDAGLISPSEIVWHSTEPEFTEGVEPFPDEERVKFIDSETLLQSIKSENSICTSMLLGLELSEVTSIRASCPGVNLVRAGAGWIQLSAGTKSLKS